MNDDLRMDLADCGSPEKLIQVILDHHPNWTAPVPVEELARDVGIVEFRELEVDKFEGALMTDPEKSRGIILTKAGAREERRRFTIGHELGHFLIPSHKGNKQCTAADLRESRRGNDHQRQEAEANRFSAGLLMPKPWFVRSMGELGDADVTHAQILAKRYKTSLEATFNRYIELTGDICAFVFSKDGAIRYCRPTRDFPKLNVTKGDQLPSRCASRAAPADILRVATGWTEMDGSTWLETEWGQRSPTVLEQSIRQQNGYQVTLLFIASEELDDDEEDAEQSGAWQPQFHKK